MKYLIIFSVLLTFCGHSKGVTTVKIGVLLMTSAPEPFDLRRVMPALDIAFERAEAEYGVRYDVVVRNYTGNCPKQTVIGYLSELFYIDNVRAVIGPACSETIEAAGRLAQYLEMPMITGVGDLIIRKTGDMYTTLTRMSYNLDRLSGKIYFKNMRRTNHEIFPNNGISYENKAFNFNTLVKRPFIISPNLYQILVYRI